MERQAGSGLWTSPWHPCVHPHCPSSVTKVVLPSAACLSHHFHYWWRSGTSLGAYFQRNLTRSCKILPEPAIAAVPSCWWHFASSSEKGYASPVPLSILSAVIPRHTINFYKTFIQLTKGGGSFKTCNPLAPQMLVQKFALTVMGRLFDPSA